jgi:hypothetical protein
MSAPGPDEPRDDGAGDDGRDLRLRDDDRQQSWLSTYGSTLFRACILVVLLVALIVLRKPCADGVAGFVGNFGEPTRAAPRDGGPVRPSMGDAAPRH